MLKVGILGYGYMGKIRHYYLNQYPDCKVQAIFHTDPIEGDFDYYDSWENIIEIKSLDAIFVCLPNYLIKDAVVLSLNAGKHVFAEKPPGISSLEVKEMIEAEKRNKKVVKFGFNHRLHPAVIKAKELVDSSDYGKILWMRGRYGKSVEPDFDLGWRSKKEFSGGGILMDQGIHMLDLFLYFCHSFEEVKSYTSNLYWKGDIEDNVFAIFRNKKGQVASLHSTMTQWRYLFSLEIFLSRGYIVVNGLLSKSGRYGQETLSFGSHEPSTPTAVHSEMKTLTFNTDLSWKLETKEFFNSIINKKNITVGSTIDALKLMVLIEKIYEESEN